MTAVDVDPAADPNLVAWPPEEKVKLIGTLSRPEVIGAGLAVAVAVVGIIAQQSVVAVAVIVPVLTWTFARVRGMPLRTRTTIRVRWWSSRRRRVWTAPIRTKCGAAPCLRDVRLLMTVDPTGDRPVAAVVAAGAGSYTVVFDVDGSSLAFLQAADQSSRFAAWGTVLGSLCTTDDRTLTAARIAWVDLHQAADPGALVAYHQLHGTPGPASGDYVAHLDGLGATGAAHRVLVAVTLTRAGQLRTARQDGLTGTVEEIMMAATVNVAGDVASRLTTAGYRCGPLLTPAEIGRVIVEAGDPFAARRDTLTTLERFAVAERYGPEQITLERHQLAIDGAYHRVFALTWPKIAVAQDWMWRPLGVEGPKIVTTVFEPIPAHRAAMHREALTTRAESNVSIIAARRRVRTIDRRKTAALHAAERKVSDGHQELDGYALVVITARTPVDLARRCQLLRQRLHESGRAGLRELTGEHDVGWAAALPIGLHIASATE